MKIKVDENLPSELVGDIRALGHDAQSVMDEHLVGSPDTELLAHVRAEDRAILTLDKGIADVRAFPPAEYPGIILLRPPATGRIAVRRFAMEHVPRLLQENLAGRLAVISCAGVRFR